MRLFRLCMHFLKARHVNPVGVGVWCFFAFCFLLNPSSPLRSGVLFDTDDYMRLNETVNWLMSAHPFGKDWFDYSYPRLSPGENPVIHWSRLVDLPLAFFAYPLVPEIGVERSVLTASFIVPPLLLTFLLWLIPFAAKPLLSKEAARMTPLFLLFAPAVLMNFMPGRVDHHGYEVIIALFAMASLTRCLLTRRGWVSSILAAVALSAGLWIGTEMLPWAGLFVAMLALLGSLLGGVALKNALVFAAVFPTVMVVTLVCAVTPDHYSDRSISWFSAADLVFALMSSFTLLAAFLSGKVTKRAFVRVAITGASGLITLLALLYFIPDILTGAYADYDDFFNETLVGNIGEARPLIAALIPDRFIPLSYAKSLYLFLQAVLLPLIAAIYACRNALFGKRKFVWFIYASFLVPALLLSVFWQSRISWFTEIFAIAPLTHLLLALWRRKAARKHHALSMRERLPTLLLLAPPFWPPLVIIVGFSLFILIRPLISEGVHFSNFSFRTTLAPLFLFLLLSSLLFMIFRLTVGRKGARFAVLSVLLCPYVLLAFCIGEADDHAYQLLLATFELLAFSFLANDAKAWRFSVAAALAGALGLSISGEALPWVICGIVYLLFLSSSAKAPSAKTCAIFGTSFFASTGISLFARPLLPAKYLATSVASAEFDVSLAASSAFVFCVLWLLEAKNVEGRLRLLVCSLLALLIGAGLFVTNSPVLQLASTRLEDYNPLLRSVSLTPRPPLWMVAEFSQQFSASFVTTFVYMLSLLALPLLGLGITGHRLFKSHARRWRLWFLNAVFLSAALLLAVFLHLSFLWFAEIFSLPALVFFLKSRKSLSGQIDERFFRRFRAPLTIAFLAFPLLLLSILEGKGDTYARALFFAAPSQAVSCPLAGVEHYLNQTYEGTPRLILSGSNEGPELLFRTHETVLSAPYNVKGNSDAFEFLNARDEEKARTIARRRGVDFILVCRSFSALYADLGTEKQRLNASVTISSDNTLHMVSDINHPAMIERLVAGMPPFWLNEIEIPDEKDYVLFAVKKD